LLARVIVQGLEGKPDSAQSKAMETRVFFVKRGYGLTADETIDVIA